MKKNAVLQLPTDSCKATARLMYARLVKVRHPLEMTIIPRAVAFGPNILYISNNLVFDVSLSAMNSNDRKLEPATKIGILWLGDWRPATR